MTFNEASCPTCGHAGWRLAKVVHLAGLSSSTSNSDGGGFGLAAGVGEGQKGVAVNYQAVHLRSEGVTTSHAAAHYAPPEEPDDYSAGWYEWLERRIADVREELRKVDEAALNPQAIVTRTWEPFGKTFDAAIQDSVDAAKNLRQRCMGDQAYEVQLSLWSVTRVCDRCGEAFITSEDKERAIEAVPSVPEFSIPELDRRCPNGACQSFAWKPARLYLQVKIDDAAALEEKAASRLSAAEAFAAAPPPKTLWKKMKRAVSLMPEPAKAREALLHAQNQLQQARAVLEEAIRERPQFCSERACSSCGTLYRLLDPEADPEL